jgi:hypothetical protein
MMPQLPVTMNLTYSRWPSRFALSVFPSRERKRVGSPDVVEIMGVHASRDFDGERKMTALIEQFLQEAPDSESR